MTVKAYTSATIGTSLSNPTNFVANAGGTCVSGSTTLAGGASCTVQIKPQASANGSLSGALTAAANNSPTISLSGTANGFTPNLMLVATSGTPSAMNVVGSAPGGSLTYGSDVVFTVTNTGGATSAVMTFALSNTSNFGFDSGGTCVSGSTSLAAGASCTIKVHPQASADATYSGNLTVTANNSPSAALSGTATKLNPVSLSIATIGTPSAMNVTGPGSPAYGSNVTFTVTNAPSADYTSTALGITLSNTSSFQFNGGTCSTSTTLAPGASCTTIVRPMASANATYSGTLNVAANNTPTTTLSGAATGWLLIYCNGVLQPAHGSCTFTYNGQYQYFQVTGNVAATIQTWGSGGSSDRWGAVGGQGGYAAAIVSLSSNSYVVFVGSASGSLGTGGVPTGADEAYCGSGCQGGDLTGVFAGSPSQGTAIVIAGGGGGAGDFDEGEYNGGNGGGDPGATCFVNSGMGGATNPSPMPGYATSGGGGGGYWGGCGGAGTGGYGGQNFTAPGGTTVVGGGAAADQNGWATISW